MVDATGARLGTLLDGFNGFVFRQVGPDRLFIQTSANGVTQSAVLIYHTTTDCSGARYLANQNGAGYFLWGFVSGVQVAYTRFVDPSTTTTMAVRSVERFTVGQDLTTPGTCGAASGNRSIGPVIIVSDPGLVVAAPLRAE